MVSEGGMSAATTSDEENPLEKQHLEEEFQTFDRGRFALGFVVILVLILIVSIATYVVCENGDFERCAYWSWIGVPVLFIQTIVCVLVVRSFLRRK